MVLLQNYDGISEKGLAIQGYGFVPTKVVQRGISAQTLSEQGDEILVNIRLIFTLLNG